MLLLHVSDFHFGPKSRFADLAPDAFAKRFAADLLRQIGELKIRGGVDVVVATGDFAESGTRKEFEQAGAFLRALAQELGLPPVRFVLLPGNHDISWAACRSVESLQEEEGFDDAELHRRLHQRKLEQYDRFVAEFYAPSRLDDLARRLDGGGWLYDFRELGLSVAALNSCEKETHRPAERVGFVSKAQAQSLLELWPSPAEGFRVLALHHPPVPMIKANRDKWKKEAKARKMSVELIDRFVADLSGIEGTEELKMVARQAGAQLVLHGHQHAGDLDHHWADGFCHVFSAGSLCLVSGELPPDVPLSCRLIELEEGVDEVAVWSLVFAPLDPAKGRVDPGRFRLDTAVDQPLQMKIRAPLPAKSPKSSSSALTAEQEHFLKVYRQAFESDFDRWDLSASGVTTADHFRQAPASLDAMYLPLRLAEGWNPRELDKGETLASESLLRRERPLLIRGQAGAGKTTWVRHSFRRLIRDPGAFPLLLVLRDLALVWRPEVQGEERSLVAYLENKIAQRLGGLLPAGQLKIGSLLAAEEGPRPILLVDGWDEIGPLGEDIRNKLRALMRLHPRLLVVVTSRPYDAGGRPSHGDGFEELDVQPLNDGEVRHLAGLFFLHIYGADAAGAEKEVTLFEKALERSEEARELGRTALLLTMMLGIHSVEPLPDKRHRLYEACIRNLLSNLPERKAEEGARTGSDQWCPDSDERLRVVARLAFQLQQGGYQNSARTAIVASKSALLPMLPNDGPWAEKKEAFLNWLVGTAGLLTDRADGSLAFSHLSFQEYLCAYHLKASRADGQLVDLARIVQWWETLVLWAALAGGESAELAEKMIGTLLDSPQPRPQLLAGMMLADGLGSEDQLGRWAVVLHGRLVEGGSEEEGRVARAFAASRREDRREALLRALDALAATAGWFLWERLAAFARQVDESHPLASPESRVAAALVGQLAGQELEGEMSAAVARCLAGAHPLWPIAPAELALLHLWPSPRRAAGAMIQLQGANGARLALSKSLVASWTRANVDEGKKRLARYLARDLARDLARYLARDLARDLARYWARDLARYLARDLARYLARYLARDWARYLARDWARNLARDWARYLARDWARDLPRDWARNRARYLARDLELPAEPGLLDVLSFELRAFGRPAARAFLASAERLPEDPRWRLLHQACRLSLNPDASPLAFEEALAAEGPRCGDELWPALARHLARRSLPGDRELLEDALRHPESRPEPLRSGLRFIARGDVIFDDGSVLTLEEICRDAGFPVDLPLLEDLPDELDLGPDWDKDLDQDQTPLFIT